MKKEQSATILYTILGCVIGYISVSLNNFYLILLLMLGVYLVTVVPLAKKITVDKLKGWLLSNTFAVYILVWLLVYLLLSNVNVV